jgi:hypothetical protein
MPSPEDALSVMQPFGNMHNYHYGMKVIMLQFYRPSEVVSSVTVQVHEPNRGFSVVAPLSEARKRAKRQWAA